MVTGGFGHELLLKMGVSAIRQGGSFAGLSPWYEWSRWTGPVWKRPSTGQEWGGNLISGWGPFDFIDFCNAAGIEPVMTTTSTTAAMAFADLVEYCHGGPTTPMGARRIADGHPLPYRVFYFELGNEGSNGDTTKDGHYVQQVEAMETKARALGLGGRFKYVSRRTGLGPEAGGWNSGWSFGSCPTPLLHLPPPLSHFRAVNVDA